MMDFRVSAVLPAAGCGQRMGISTPKQFSYLLGRPLISYCLESFERIPWIDNIVVTVSPESIQSMQDIVSCFNHKRVLLVPGGFVRHRSIYNGVKALKKVSPDVVVIHDAVRPLVDEDTVKQVAVAAWEYGSSGAVRPLVSTVIATDLDGFLDHSLDRSKYRSSEMPQAFCYDVLCKAYQKATDYDFDYGTECLHLVNKYTDARTRLIDGPEHLWKVTYKKDMFALEGLLKEQENVVGISSVIPVDFRDLITAAVLARCMKVCPVDDISSAPEDINNFVFTATSDCLESFQGFLDAALNNLLKLNRRGTLVCVLSHCEASVDGGNSHVEFRRIVKGKSREARSHGVCVNGAVCQASRRRRSHGVCVNGAMCQASRSRSHGVYVSTGQCVEQVEAGGHMVCVSTGQCARQVEADHMMCVSTGQCVRQVEAGDHMVCVSTGQ